MFIRERNIRQLLLGIFLAAWFAVASAGTLYLNNQDSWPVALTEHIHVFEDTTARLNIEDVATLPLGQPDAFMPATANLLEPGFSESAWWLQLNIVNNNTTPLSLRLAASSSLLGQLDFYIKHDKRWLHTKAGDMVPLSVQSDNSTRLQAFSLQLDPGEFAKILLRVQSDRAIRLRPTVYSEAAYRAAENRTVIWDGILFGGLLAMAWCAFLVALFSRSWRFFWLSALCFIIALYEATVRGYSKFYLWPQATDWADRSASVLAYLILMLFIVSVLQMAKSENIAWPRRRYFIALAIVELIMILITLLGDLHWANRMGTLVALVHGISLLIAAVLLLKRSAPTGRLMLLTGAFFLFHTILRVLEYTGLMPEWIVQLGIDNAGTNPILALVSLGTNLAVLTGWIVLAAQQRKNARDKLAACQAQEQERLKDEVARQTAALNKASRHAAEAPTSQATPATAILMPTSPPADACVELATLARDGQLTGIENWLQRIIKAYPQHAQFFREIQDALHILDFEKIETIALEKSK